MNKTLKGIIITFGIILGLLVVYFMTPSGRETWNRYIHGIEKADDDTNYNTLKTVEDTARAMVSTYKADKVTYESYKDNEDKDMKDVALQAKIRANTTAISYNEYILKNSYVWKDNIPSDINLELPLLE